MNKYNSVVSVLYYQLMSIYCSSVLHNNKLNYIIVHVMLTCTLSVKRKLQFFSHKRDLLRNTLCSPRDCQLDTPVVLFLPYSLQCQMPLNKSSAVYWYGRLRCPVKTYKYSYNLNVEYILVLFNRSISNKFESQRPICVF